MLPSFRPGEMLLVCSYVHNLTAVARGAVVIFCDPKGSTMEFLKRIVGLPGDKVDISSGTLRINGEYINTKCVDNDKSPVNLLDNNWQLHENEFFMLGDLGTFSTDSRTLGPIPTRLIVGTVWCRIWPPRRWQIF